MLTGKARSLFAEWLTAKNESEWGGTFKGFYCALSESMQWGVYEEWADSLGFYFFIEPHLGGGGVAFYCQIRWRNADFIDQFWEDRWDDGSVRYYNSRQEARKAAIERLNELINQQTKTNHQTTPQPT